MKLSAWTLSAATVATITTTSTFVVAFTSPSNNLVVKRLRMTTTSSTLHQQLSFVGDDVRESKWHASPLTSFDNHGRVGSSPGHFDTHGTPTTQQVSSHHMGSSLPPLTSFDQYGRVGSSPGSFITHGIRTMAPGRTYIIGDTVRESRASYAPMDHYGRVGTLGEVGTEDDNGSSKRYIPASGYYIQPIVSSEFIPHSSSSSSSYSNTSSRNFIASGGSTSYSSTPVKKVGYGLGGWKK